MSNIINCKAIRDKYIEDIKKKDLKGCTVAFVQIGNNPASNIYVRNKIKLCEEVGIKVIHHKFEEFTPEKHILFFINELNNCELINGIMVQLPLPKHIDENKIINAINPNKDIDGFHIANKGKVVIGDKDGVIAATPKGIMTIFKEEGIDLKGKNVVVVGRSNIVGKPLVSLLINSGATVTCCNSKTSIEVLLDLIFNADIFISAIGQANYFNKKLFSNYGYLCEVSLNYVIGIDVGINRNSEGKLCGDIDKELYPYFKRITSVPGGVGLTTQLSVVSNIVELYERNKR